MARLVINPGSPGTWEIQLKPGANAIGRGPVNDFKLADPSVSTSHCLIVVGDGSVIIKDLGSSNGTFVDRTPIQEAFLQNGQTVHLGGMEMMFFGDESPVIVPTAPAKAPLRATILSPRPAEGSPAAAMATAPGLPPPITVARSVPAAVPITAMPAAGRGQLATAAPKATPTKKPSFGLGVLGALIGTLVGSLIYFLMFNYMGLRLKLIAIGVGYLAGLGAELLGQKEGSKELGMIAAALALGGIIGAQYLVARNWWHEGEISRAKERESAYAEAVVEAKKVLAAVPTGSDQEIRLYLAKEAADEGEKPDVKSVSQEEIKTFRETTLSEMRDLAGGKITKADYEKKNGLDQVQTKEEKDSEEGTFKAIFLLLLLSRLNLFSLVAAAALAYKVCANA